MLKLCPLFSGRAKLVCSKNYIKPTMYNITIASPISNQARRLLGDLCKDYMDHALFL